MSASPSSSAHEARRAIAQRLRAARLQAGLTGHKLSLLCGWHAAKTSRIENAKAVPTAADIRIWLEACRAGEEIPDLLAAARTADSMYVEWRRLHRGLRGIQESYRPLYVRTQVFRVYCSNVIPGLLQTPEYAAALMGMIADFHGTSRRDSDEAAAARTERSQMIGHGRRRFALLIEEPVLRNHVGGPDVMAHQLRHLLEAMAQPAVSVGVIPAMAPRRMWPQETFSVFDEECVEVELLTARVMVTTPTELRLYLKAFRDLAAMAAHGSAARELIAGALASLE
ncbi:helix-turn-helix domain-containing protein [Streptomyces xiamenensis]